MPIVTVSAPLCAPSRQEVTGRLRERLGVYGFRLGRVTAEEVKDGLLGTGKPLYWLINVEFSSDKTARWGEYMFARLAMFYHIVGRYREPRNAQWAAKYLGRKTAWKEHDCDS